MKNSLKEIIGLKVHGIIHYYPEKNFRHFNFRI
jgi:hypothetical protein